MLKLATAGNTSIQSDAFKKWLMVSVAVHIGFVFFVTIKNFVFPSKTLIIQNAIRVDMIGLPDKKEDPPKAVAQPKEEPAPKAAPKPEVKQPEAKKEVAKPKPKEPVNLAKEKAKQEQAMEKLKQLSAIDKIKNSAGKTEAAAPKKTVENLPQFKGNQVVAGNSFTGMAGLAAQDYFSDAKAHIQNFWALPEWLANSGLRASVVVMIDAAGRVIRSEINESSGQTAFDDAALSAVASASPFPIPPDAIRDTIVNSWMIFNFPE